jgi:hypothetical protein
MTKNKKFYNFSEFGFEFIMLNHQLNKLHNFKETKNKASFCFIIILSVIMPSVMMLNVMALF